MTLISYINKYLCDITYKNRNKCIKYECQYCKYFKYYTHYEYDDYIKLIKCI